MAPKRPLDHELLSRLLDLPEIARSGFSVRSGFTGDGMTVLRGAHYVGSWRERNGMLQWTGADTRSTASIVPTVDDALKLTLMMILRHLEISHFERRMAMAG
jgi:hypothetical protein